jgi:hypothetical protein
MSQNESDANKISAEQAQVVTPPLSVVVSDDETDSASTSQELRKVVDALQNTVKPNGGDQFTPQQDTSSQVDDSTQSTEEIKDLSDEVSAVEIASARSEEAEIVPPTPGTPPFSSEEEALEDDAYTGNNVTLDNVDIKLIQPNLLEPREQEKAGKCCYWFMINRWKP